jgi:lipopolysaccharide biosynthesis glycosyltransferase
MNTVYIGYDYREALAYNVAEHSIKSRSVGVRVQMLRLQDLRSLIYRKVEMRGNQMWCPISEAPVGTEFTFSRFLIPKMDSGWSIFMDCDIVCVSDIRELFEFINAPENQKYAAMCVKHNYVPKEKIHMVDQIQTVYDRKNWASVIAFNCDHEAHRRLSFEDINTWPGRDLHALKWMKDEEIGELPAEWNHLVDVNDPNPGAKILHYTLGGPWIPGWQPKESDNAWIEEYNKFISL